MRKFFRNNWLLIIALVFAAALRLWHLGSTPPSLTQDEASLGYNAYSILKTGRDEYGKVLPVIFKSFGDYKPGLYVYLDVPFVAVLGLNEVSTRLPSALAGILSVYLIYLVAKILFPGKRKLPEIAALVMALTPWSIYFSRGAWEANVVLTITLAGIYFFLKALHSSKYLVLSTVFFALTLLTYQGAKLASAVVVLILIAVYWKEFFAIGKKYIISSIVVGAVLSLPVILSLFNGQAGRLDVFSIFSYPRPADYTQAFLNEGGEKVGSVTYYLYHSEALNFVREILYRWFNHFSGRFLFFEGDYQNPGHSAPYQGMLLLGDLLLLPAGLFFVFKNFAQNHKSYLFIFLWLILSPLPAILSRDQVQSVRALNMAVPVVLVIGIGLTSILVWIANRKTAIFYYLLLAALYLGGFVYFLDAYFVHVPAHNSSYWNYGYRQVVEKIAGINPVPKNVVVEQSFAQPYIYFLFYQKYDPARYQKQAMLSKSANINDVGLVTNLDNIRFQNIDWSALRRERRTVVVVGFQTPIPQDLSYDLIDKIMYLNGRDLAFTIIRIK